MVWVGTLSESIHGGYRSWFISQRADSVTKAVLTPSLFFFLGGVLGSRPRLGFFVFLFDWHLFLFGSVSLFSTWPIDPPTFVHTEAYHSHIA